MQKLINELTKQTQPLKIQYIEMTKKWAERQWKINKERSKKYCKITRYKNFARNGVELVPRKEYFEESRFYYNTPAWKLTPEFVVRMEKRANEHYTISIEKLAYRIKLKGLNLAKLHVTFSQINVNIDITITDGIKTVHAFTIIAAGPIQRPHYRYLIK